MLINNNNSHPSSYHIRIWVVFCFFMACYIVSIARLVAIASTDNTQVALFFPEEEMIGSRRDIIDRNGEVVAVNLSTNSIYANPKKILNASDAAIKLKTLFPDLDLEKLKANLSANNKSFIWIKRNLTPKQTLQINNLGIPGIYFKKGYKRVYPHGNLLSHVLGFVGIDGNGIAGVEKYFDEKLMSKDNNDQPLELSVDIRVQNIVHEELSKAIKTYNATGGVGIVMDVNTGEVIAMASLPDFDPHKPGNSKQEALFNRATLGVYEMGSIFKTFTIAMALDSNKVKLNDVYDVDKPIKAAKFTINDFSRRGGWQSVPEIFLNSSNIGIAKIASEIGTQTQKNYISEFEFLTQSEIELPEKAKPIYPSDAKWGDISTMTIGYGYGIAVTPLHIVKSLSAAVNGGRLHKATLIKQKNFDKTNSKKILKDTTSINIRKLLRLVVENGTGRQANIEGYLVGGKTGTAYKSFGGGYNKNERISSFTGVFPIHNPQFAIIAMLDEPKGTEATRGFATGGIVSAPIVGNIITRLSVLYGIEPINSKDPHILKQLYLEYKTKNENETF